MKFRLAKLLLWLVGKLIDPHRPKEEENTVPKSNPNCKYKEIAPGRVLDYTFAILLCEACEYETTEKITIPLLYIGHVQWNDGIHDTFIHINREYVCPKCGNRPIYHRDYCFGDNNLHMSITAIGKETMSP